MQVCLHAVSFASIPILIIVPVARIAYLSSDIVLSVQPAIGTDSIFSRQLQSLVSRKKQGFVSKEPEVSDVDSERLDLCS